MFFDIATVLTAFISLGTGVWAITSRWARVTFSMDDYFRGDIAAWLHAANIATTMLAACHVALMLYWSGQPGGDVIGPFVNAAFEWWHILTSTVFACLHCLFKALVPKLADPDGLIRKRLFDHEA